MVETKRRDVVVYTLYVVGLFGRNRAPKRTSFSLYEGEASLPETEVRALMDAKVAELKVKSGAQLHVMESLEWVEDRSDGITVRGIHISQSRHVINTTL